jgi:CheY-like chemotaxis protein
VASSQTRLDRTSVATPPLHLRVLLVEDHETTREGTKKLLSEEGVTVIEATGAKQALPSWRTSRSTCCSST